MIKRVIDFFDLSEFDLSEDDIIKLFENYVNSYKNYELCQKPIKGINISLAMRKEEVNFYAIESIAKIYEENIKNEDDTKKIFKTSEQIKTPVKQTMTLDWAPLRSPKNEAAKKSEPKIVSTIDNMDDVWPMQKNSIQTTKIELNKNIFNENEKLTKTICQENLSGANEQILLDIFDTRSKEINKNNFKYVLENKNFWNV